MEGRLPGWRSVSARTSHGGKSEYRLVDGPVGDSAGYKGGFDCGKRIRPRQRRPPGRPCRLAIYGSALSAKPLPTSCATGPMALRFVTGEVSLPPQRTEYILYDLAIIVNPSQRASLRRTQRDMSETDIGAGSPAEVSSGVADGTGKTTSKGVVGGYGLSAVYHWGHGHTRRRVRQMRHRILKLKAVASKVHSAAALSIPRNRNLRTPCCSLMVPKTGSTSCFLSCVGSHPGTMTAQGRIVGAYDQSPSA